MSVAFPNAKFNISKEVAEYKITWHFKKCD